MWSYDTCKETIFFPPHRPVSSCYCHQRAPSCLTAFNQSKWTPLLETYSTAIPEVCTHIYTMQTWNSHQCSEQRASIHGEGLMCRIEPLATLLPVHLLAPWSYRPDWQQKWWKLQSIESSEIGFTLQSNLTINPTSHYKTTWDPSQLLPWERRGKERLTTSDSSIAAWGCDSSFSTVRLQSGHTHTGSCRSLGALKGWEVVFCPTTPVSRGVLSLRSLRHSRQRSPVVLGALWFRPKVNGVCDWEEG